MRLLEQVSEWDSTYRKLKENEVLWSQNPEIEDFVPLLKKSRATRILDAGCGDGKNLVSLIQDEEFFCVGCDGSPTALRVCDRQVQKAVEQLATGGSLPKERMRHYCLVEAELARMPFLDDHFDAALCIDVINHNPNPFPILTELRRVVKPGGYVYLSLFNTDDEIVQDPKQKALMTEMPRGIRGREYLYEFVNGDMGSVRYYFRFIKAGEVDDFLAPAGFQLVEKHVKAWPNPPHPHFRPYPHTHCNHMVTLKNTK